MAFQLTPDESTPDGLRRLVRRALQSARKGLTASASARVESVHGARKSLKKARAIRDVIDADSGTGLSGSGKRLRTVNRMLSRLRDADALIETLRVLQDRHPDLFSEDVYARVRRNLTTSKQAMMRKAVRDGSLKQAARALGQVRKAASRWEPRHRGFDALGPGLRKTHRRARRTLALARSEQSPETFHEWRKALKTLWYELRLIGGGSAAIARDLRALTSAQKWLGDDHNLLVLSDELARDISVCRTPLDVQRLRSAVDADQRALRRKAVARTTRIFAVKPRDYVRRAEQAWKRRGHIRPRDSHRRPSRGPAVGRGHR